MKRQFQLCSFFWESWVEIRISCVKFAYTRLATTKCKNCMRAWCVVVSTPKIKVATNTTLLIRKTIKDRQPHFLNRRRRRTARRRPTMKNSEQQRPPTTFALLTTYLIFGALHEFAHLFMASWLLSPPQKQAATPFNEDDSNFLSLVLRILLGRCVTIPVASSSTNNDIDDELTSNISIITHTGWIVSVVIAILCHILYKKSTLLNSPMVPLIAYITALEGMTTDLFGFVPHHHHQQHAWQQQLNGYHHYLTFFCGNFGILLLNSSWLSIDGGRTALDVLEKMVSFCLSGCLHHLILNVILHPLSLSSSSFLDILL
jgi:hypothetical protein